MAGLARVRRGLERLQVVACGRVHPPLCRHVGTCDHMSTPSAVESWAGRLAARVAWLNRKIKRPFPPPAAPTLSSTLRYRQFPARAHPAATTWPRQRRQPGLEQQALGLLPGAGVATCYTALMLD